MASRQLEEISRSLEVALPSLWLPHNIWAYLHFNMVLRSSQLFCFGIKVDGLFLVLGNKSTVKVNYKKLHRILLRSPYKCFLWYLYPDGSIGVLEVIESW